MQAHYPTTLDYTHICLVGRRKRATSGCKANLPAPSVIHGVVTFATCGESHIQESFGVETSIDTYRNA
jgi:hypothetical protein